MAPTDDQYLNEINLDNCAEEPIHIIGKSQAHGVLLACDPVSMEITQAGENTLEFFELSVKEILGKPLSFILGKEQEQNLAKKKEASQRVEVKGQKFHLHSHISGQSLVLDFEPLKAKQDAMDLQEQLSSILDSFQQSESVEDLSKEAANITRRMFGYDRVMIYRFDEHWNGEVLAESKEKDMESWLGLRYPATDIPAQSRNLFLKHQVRIITNVSYTPVPIKPEISPLTGEPLDISKSNLRAVSPIHIEYLKNMGVGASLSAAVIVGGKLWGLIACHHRSEKFLDFYERESCRFLARMFSNEITLLETKSFKQRSQQSEKIRLQLVRQLEDQSDVFSAFTKSEVKFTHLIQCGGGAIYNLDRWQLCGKTPAVDQLNILLKEFIREQPESLFLTRNLSQQFPEAETYKEVASGLLSLKISENKYILWFRPEEVQVVTWGGNPEHKAFYNEKEKRLSPRKSFAKWTENLAGFSFPWQELDRIAARAFRENISYILLSRQRREIQALNTKLLAANKELELFSYGLSHDLRAPVRGMEGFLNILLEDFGEGIGGEGKDMLQRSIGLTEKMNALIDDLLEYFKLGYSGAPQVKEVDTSKMIGEVLELFNLKANFSRSSIKIQQQLPNMKGDRHMLFQLWSNLLNNALKYSSEEENAVVEIGTATIEDREVFFIKDNGIGVHPKMQKKIFETFQRAVGSKFPGTGIGLALVQRIVEKHQGKIWLESELGKGSIFYFYLEPHLKAV